MTAQPPEYIEDVADLHIRSDMTPVERAQIHIRRALATVNSLHDIGTRLLG